MKPHKILNIGNIVLFGAILAVVIFGIVASSVTRVSNPKIIPAVSISKPQATYEQSACQASGKYCRKALLQTINYDRIAMGLKPYAMDWHELYGFNGCVGTRGKTLAMAESGFIWHVNSSYPQASFPTNICGFGTMTPYGFIGAAAENVSDTTGTEWQAALQSYNQMKGEGKNGGHFQNLFSSTYTSVAIGIRNNNGTYYIAEDFEG